MDAKTRLSLLTFFLIFTATILSNYTFAQQRVIDSLKIKLAKTGTDTNRVKILNDLAYYSYSIKLSDLISYANQALTVAKKINYTRGEAGSYTNLGLGYLGNNANPLALTYFDKAFKLYTMLHNKENCGAVLSNIGYYYNIIQDHQQELKYMLQAYDELKVVGSPLSKSTILGNIGAAYENLGNTKKAKEYYLINLALCKKYNLNTNLVTCLTNIASATLKEKNIKRAMSYCVEALNIQKKYNVTTPRDLINIYLIQSEIFYDLKDYDKSGKLLELSTGLSKNLGEDEYQPQIYYRNYLLDSVSNNTSSALKNHLQFTRLKDSLNSVNKNRLIALYQVKFETERQINENEKLKIDRDKNEAIISKQHIIQSLMIFGLIVFSTGTIYLYRINQQIKEKNATINNQNIVKDKLFSVISHDLRSPLAQAVSMLSILEADDLSISEVLTVTPVVKAEIENTLTLMDNLLLWSKNQLNGFQYNPTMLNFRQLVDEVLHQLNQQIQKKIITVQNTVNIDHAASADLEMMRIILRNIVSNAVKFTPLNGKITISSSITSDLFILFVEDNGIGIKIEDQDRLFSSQSYTTTGTANEKGTGLGLKICNDFIALHNGRLWVESVEGKGSRFYVSLPLKQV